MIAGAEVKCKLTRPVVNILYQIFGIEFNPNIPCIVKIKNRIIRAVVYFDISIGAFIQFNAVNFEIRFGGMVGLAKILYVKRLFNNKFVVYICLPFIYAGFPK